MNYILLLGGNIGERAATLQNAKDAILKVCGPILKSSQIYETQAWGVENQQDFLNQVVVVDSNENPFIFLFQLLQIEKDLGRIRFEKWGERVIDIDILFIDQDIIESRSLTVPHIEVQNRNFALAPLAEIMPDLIHPILKKSISDLLEECKDHLKAQVYH